MHFHSRRTARPEGDTSPADLVIAIATINAFNRINATTRQITGDWAREWVEQSRHTEQAAWPGASASAAGRRVEPAARAGER